jgi:hypothetical protein
MRKIKYQIFATAFLVASACFFTSTSHARKVANVVIEKTGQSRDPQEAKHCAKFQPTVVQVKRFFSKAFPVTQRVVLHDWYSFCYAKGTLSFLEGSESHWNWTLYSGGTAIIDWAEGDTVYLYNGRNNGWFDPEACSYGGNVDECIIPGS